MVKDKWIEDDIEYRKKKYNCYTRSQRIDRLTIFSIENREKPTKAEAQFLTLLYQVHKYLELSQKIDIGAIYTQQIIASNTAKTGYILDFYLPRINLAFEVDGSFHDNPRNTIN
jgi:very-short-patch-repair endonuclease